QGFPGRKVALGSQRRRRVTRTQTGGKIRIVSEPQHLNFCRGSLHIANWVVIATRRAFVVNQRSERVISNPIAGSPSVQTEGDVAICNLIRLVESSHPRENFASHELTCTHDR